MRQWVEIFVPPPSFGPEQWPFDALVGIVVPVMTETEVKELPSEEWLGPELAEPSYVISLCELVVSIGSIKQDRAVWFWQSVMDADQLRHIRFGHSVCRLVNSPSLERSTSSM